MAESTHGVKRSPTERAVGWFLILSYVIGAPLFAIVEARTGLMSQRFLYPSAFLYAVAAAQFICAPLLLHRRAAPVSAAILTVLSIGAAVSHFRIYSPLTSLPAIGYTALQAWYGYRLYVQQRRS